MKTATLLRDKYPSTYPLNLPPEDGHRRFASSYLLISPSGVLYDDTLWWRWLLQMVSRFGLHTDAGAFTALWQHEYYDDVCCGQREFFTALREFLTTCGMRPGQIDELCAAGRLHWKRLELDLRSFPQTAQALASLTASGWRMGLLVNGPLPRDVTKTQLERMDILRYFEHVIYSGEISAGLAHDDAWPIVLQHVGVTPEAVAYVAHDRWLLSPAKHSGLTTIAYQCPAAKADFQIGQLSDLASLTDTPARLQAA